MILSDPNGPTFDYLMQIDANTIDIIREGLDNWKKNIAPIADEYLGSDRKEIEFFIDIVLLCSSLFKLPKNYLELLKFRDAGSLMHNRIMAQVIAEYYDPKIKLSLARKNNTNKIHDFNIGLIKCEVKTIQSIGELEWILGGHRLTDSSYRSLVSAIRDDIEDAKKVGSDGMVFISPWSYNINSLFRLYFKNKLVITPPIPIPGTTTLVVSSRYISENYYVTFQTDQFLLNIESALTVIQTHRLAPIELNFVRRGFVFEATTAGKPNSSVGYSFKIR
ncbi:hypothetical protein [Candidatus Nitrosocosmicus arcticus]|uniref:Uncharacterized protein n=1 Tax=Candidatus Nitrosocosmicus arcticus TaxID=2035267 RepID=A0A557SXF5_9ARCH|nr:hypothetical protein [Candidatus Nitrosocosmicus arcticus]TVP41286.1 hypothetical protein NARC_40251 [Candidatus Nitrosocosmicus arcticus]